MPSGDLKSLVLRTCRERGIQVQDRTALQNLVGLVEVQVEQEVAIQDIFSRIVQGGYKKLTQECVLNIIQQIKDDYNAQGGSCKKQKLEVVDVYSVQRIAFDPVQKAFQLDSKHTESIQQNMFGYSSADNFKNRYLVLQQWLKRCPSFETSSIYGDHESKSPLVEIKGLMGSLNKKRFTYGMLSCPAQGQLELIDTTGTLSLDVTDIQQQQRGFFTENMMVIVEGTLRLDQKFHVDAMAMPPIESRESAISVLQGYNTFGGQARAVTDDVPEEFQDQNRIKENGYFVVINDVQLEQQCNVEKLHKVLQNYESRLGNNGNQDLPEAFILVGDFLSQSLNQYRQVDIRKHYDLKEAFQKVADIFSEYANIKDTCTVILVPGQNDMCGLPRLPQLPFAKVDNMFEELQEQQSDKFVLSGNPSRFRLCGREIVLFQQEIFNSIHKACVVPPKSTGSDIQLLFEDVVYTLLSQYHLCPYRNQSNTPVCNFRVWGYDHLLWLYPTPHTLILAQPYSAIQAKTTINGCSAFTTGSFCKAGQFVECWYQEGQNDNLIIPHLTSVDQMQTGVVLDDFQMLEI
eukprot:TRINITY_DN2643_c0_g1_i14.p1 TRINITY_DN2643_c0_g1~~TRINITY_DN2643_c0_g1_i14.p1  ORF type:complete len:589 (-),score=65.90 TRINITY_DN2643_c0_g1_i14:816-2534(-)